MINTRRLSIIPLNVNQLEKYAANDFSLETSLNVNKSNRIISEKIRTKIIENIIPEILNNNINYLYKTIWIAIDNENKNIICEICFKGIPDAKSKVEIGYETYVEFRGKGYMTEVVAGIIIWAKNQQEIKAVCAETAKDNLGSNLVLEKNNFKKITEDQKYFYWEYTL